MKPSFILTVTLAMLVFDAKTSARPGRRKSSPLSDEDLDTGNSRKTRHSRQIYPPHGYHPGWPPYESNYNRPCENHVYKEIDMKLKLIIDLLSSSRQNTYTQNTHPVIIPYPYPVMIGLANASLPSFDSRLGPTWGIIPSTSTEAPSDDDDEDSSRPINLVPPKDYMPTGVYVPPVEHGSIQGNEPQTTKKPQITTEAPKKNVHNPSKCQAAILNCCRFEEPNRQICFEEIGCSRTYKTGKACLPEAINMVIKIFTDAYKPR